jgi:F0F1-type ATP synthase membrane subunit c/vacuolar-type H+-ATPase subunit K
MTLEAAKVIGAGMATISMAGTGTGIGVLFGAFLNALARNPNISKTLFVYTILGFALTEAIALFGLMITFLLLFAF